jgi:hypothetical protein
MACLILHLIMTNIAKELDARLRQLDAETARRLESLVRDALALTVSIGAAPSAVPKRQWPLVPGTGRTITQEEIDSAIAQDIGSGPMHIF